jgi:hypothetical protein
VDKDGFDNSPTHPVRAPKSTKIQIPDNVTKLPGMGMRRARIFKNNMLDAVLGPEQVTPDEPSEHDEKMPPEVAERFDAHLASLMAKDRTDHLNDGIADGSRDARIISMGKFKEDKANRELMSKYDE